MKNTNYVPTFETIYKNLDQYFSVEEAKSKGLTKNNMSCVSLYNLFVNEVTDFVNMDIKNFNFLVLSYRHTAQQNDLNLKNRNKLFLKNFYNVLFNKHE